jgi:hypothetical protein
MTNNKKQNDFGLLHVEERMVQDRRGRTFKARMIKDKSNKIWAVTYSWKFTKLMVIFLLKKYGTELLEQER